MTLLLDNLPSSMVVVYEIFHFWSFVRDCIGHPQRRSSSADSFRLTGRSSESDIYKVEKGARSKSHVTSGDNPRQRYSFTIRMLLRKEERVKRSNIRTVALQNHWAVFHLWLGDSQLWSFYLWQRFSLLVTGDFDRAPFSMLYMSFSDIWPIWWPTRSWTNVGNRRLS